MFKNAKQKHILLGLSTPINVTAAVRSPVTLPVFGDQQRLHRSWTHTERGGHLSLSLPFSSVVVAPKTCLLILVMALRKVSTEKTSHPQTPNDMYTYSRYSLTPHWFHYTYHEPSLTLQSDFSFFNTVKTVLFLLVLWHCWLQVLGNILFVLCHWFTACAFKSALIRGDFTDNFHRRYRKWLGPHEWRGWILPL